VLSRLFQDLFLEGLTAAFEAGELQFFTDLVGLNDAKAFAAALAPLRKTEWMVYAKQPFAGPKQVLAYLARYTHRVAIANSRLLGLDQTHVSFRWKDYWENGVHKTKVMRIEIAEFIRRFLLHILPSGFHRIRHYGLFANGHRADKLALCRTLLGVRPAPVDNNNDDQVDAGATNHESPPCPCCGGRMKVFESFNGPVSRPYHVRRLDAL
jgi:Putative transposase